MVRSKTPQQKKKESYASDRVEGGEYPHADRRNRPRTKAQGQRQLRRVSKQLLTTEPEETLQLPNRTRLGWCKSSVGLPEHLERTKRNRIEREAHNIFRKGYSTITHARFRDVVNTWMNGVSPQTALLADFYHNVLNGFPDEAQGTPYGQGWLPQRREFLRRFFDQEPDLRRSFEEWIGKLIIR